MSDLEKQFNLAERNPDQGGGILYCMRYSGEHIDEHHAQIVEALKRMGITFTDEGDNIGARADTELSPEAERQVTLLLEELSVINEAREYKEAGLDDVKNIRELSDYLISTFYSLLKSKNISDAYNFVTVFIPRIISDISLADRQNKVLTNQDRAALDKLSEFMKSKEKQLNSHRITILS